jgi:HSP20 family protein
MNTMMHHPGFAMMNMTSNGISMSSINNISPTISEDKNNNYIVTLHMPGLDKSEINAEINGNILTISGVKREESSRNINGGRTYTASYRSFQNSFSLPAAVKSKGLKLDYNNDILTVKIPKK